MQLLIQQMLNNNNDNRKITIPPGYRDLLRDMTVDVLRNQPQDPLVYCIDWLTNKRRLRDGDKNIAVPTPTSAPPAAAPPASAAPAHKMGGLTINKQPASTVTPPSQTSPGGNKQLQIDGLKPDKIIRQCRLFSNVPPDELNKLCDLGELVNTVTGEEFRVRSDIESDKLYIVGNGHFDVFIEMPKGRSKVCELNNFGYFGDGKKEMRVVAKNNGKLVVLKCSAISTIVFDKIQQKRDLYSEFMEDMELFEKISQLERNILIDSIVEKDFPEESEIIKQGDPSEEMFLLFEGFGAVIKDGNEISSVAEGGFFGELGLMENQPRSATVVATSSCKVLCLPIDLFKHLILPRCRDLLDKTVKRYLRDPDDNEEDDSDMDTPPYEKVNMPRKSVSAGKFNPEMLEEDDEEEIQEELKKPELQKTDQQLERLRECCKKIMLFRCLDDDELEVVIGIMFPKQVHPGDVIIELGDDGDNFYVIDNGVYDIKVLVKGVETVVAQFKGEGSFGELALMYNTPRSATVIAVSEGLLWALSRDMFRKIVLKKAFQKRIMYENLIGQVPLLKELSAYEKMNIADALRTRIYDAGSHIINQGDDGFEMYFIEEGRVEIYVDFKDGSEPELIGELERGKYFGEMALITHKPRAASAVAKSRCKIAVIDRESFERLLGPCVQIMKRNMETYNQVAARKSTMQRLEDSTST